MRWIERQLRGNRVYVRADENGAPLTDAQGRVEVVYSRAEGAKVYRASVKNLEATDAMPDEPSLPPDPEPPPDPDAIVIYTDGACHGNPGPMGVGVVIRDKGELKEISEYLGQGTNNIAELTAIERALEWVPKDARKRRAVHLHSDSSYAIGLLTKDWKPKANQELVARLRALAKTFARLTFIKVKGHAGVPDNERCDELANAAVLRGR
jgi:ribonuclease HI